MNNVITKGHIRIRNATALVMALALLAGVMALTVTAGATGGILLPTSAMIVGGPVNVYATASTGSAVITTLYTGNYVTVVSYGTSWSQLSLPGNVYGWVPTGNLSFTPIIQPTVPPIITAPPSIVATAVVRSGPLNVHTYGSTQAPVITQLATGTRVSVIRYSTDWTQIWIGSQVGYVATSYLTFGTTPPIVTPAPTDPVSERVNTAGANATIATTNRGPLRLREHPSQNATILATYSNGSRVQVLGQTGGWYQVRAGSRSGYMAVEHIDLDDSANVPGAGGIDAVVANPSSGQVLHMRARPDTRSNIVASYRNGQYVRVLAVGTEWHHVEVDGHQGFMMSQYVRITTPGATATMTIYGAGNSVPVHTQANGTSATVAQLTDGALVTVIVPDVSWSRVRLDSGEVGYVQNQYLHRDGAAVTDAFQF